MQSKIAFVHNLPIGGAKRHFSTVLPKLADDLEVTIFEFESRDRQIFEILSRIGGGKRIFPAVYLPSKAIMKIPLFGQMIRNYFQRKSFLPMAAEINAGSYDCVLVAQCRNTNTPSILADIRIPQLFFCHEPTRGVYEAPIRSASFGLGRYIKKIINILPNWYTRQREANLAKYPNKILVNSYYSAEVIKRHFAIDSSVVYPGVDCSAFRRLAILKKDFVLSVGSLHPLKGHDFAIKCVAKIDKLIRPRLLIISPHGTQASTEMIHLNKLAKDLDVMLEFFSDVDDDTLVILYNEALAALVTSHLEPFGFTAVESMACCTPVFAVAEGGMRETVLFNSGGEVLPRDPEVFARRISEVLKAPHKGSEMGIKGREWVEKNFSLEKSAYDLSKILQSTSVKP